MPRNGAGTYSLPAGNPVVTGTTVSSTWSNTTLADISSEITNSLARDGTGAMAAPIQLDDGAVSAPALTFESDPDTGVYSVAANTPGMAAGGSQIQRWTTTGTVVTGTASVSGASTLTGAVTASSTLGVTGASTLTGAVTASSTLDVTGAITGAAGATLTQSASNTSALTVTGNGTAYGALVRSGTATSAAAPRDALVLDNGHLSLNGSTAPNSDVGFQNKLTPMNLVKAWGSISLVSGTPTVVAGFNIGSVAAVSSSEFQVAFAHQFTSTAYMTIANRSAGTQRALIVYAYPVSSSVVAIGADIWSAAGGGSLVQFDLASGNHTITFVCFGAH